MSQHTPDKKLSPPGQPERSEGPPDGHAPRCHPERSEGPPDGSAAVKKRAPDPYAHAPLLPVSGVCELVDIHTLATGEGYEMEIGPGRGGFIFERLEARPGVAMVNLEIRRKWATIVDDRLKARGYGRRARVFAEDAKESLPRLGPDGVLDVIYLHFPDPWWKKRHTKRLVMGDVFLREVSRLLHDKGALYIQTDVEERAAQYEEHVMQSGLFKPAGDTADSPRMAENPYGARSPREHRAVADGLPVHRMRFAKA